MRWLWSFNMRRSLQSLRLTSDKSSDCCEQVVTGITAHSVFEDQSVVAPVRVATGA